MSIMRSGHIALWGGLRILELVDVDVDGKEALVFRDGQGYFVETRTAHEIIDRLLLAYNAKKIEEVLGDKNSSRYLRDIGFDFKRSGRYVRHDKLVYKQREFDPFKRKWSFQCGFCGKKVSIDAQPDYFYIIDYEIRTEAKTLSDRACSETCAKHIWDDYLERWLKKNGYPTDLGKY